MPSPTAGMPERTVKLTDLEIAWLLTKLGAYTAFDRELATKLREVMESA